MRSYRFCNLKSQLFCTKSIWIFMPKMGLIISCIVYFISYPKVTTNILQSCKIPSILPIVPNQQSSKNPESFLLRIFFKHRCSSRRSTRIYVKDPSWACTKNVAFYTLPNKDTITSERSERVMKKVWIFMPKHHNFKVWTFSVK